MWITSQMLRFQAGLKEYWGFQNIDNLWSSVDN